MYRNVFPDDRSGADFGTAFRGWRKVQNLGVFAHDRAWIDFRISANFGETIQRDIVVQVHAITELYIRPNNAERSDTYIGPQHRAGRDYCRSMHGHGFLSR